MLGSKSPKAKLEHENRISMGGSVSMTPFSKLVSLASHLIRSQTTKSMVNVEGVSLKTPESYIKFKSLVGDPRKKQDEAAPLETKYMLSQEAYEYFTNPDLIQFIL